MTIDKARFMTGAAGIFGPPVELNDPHEGSIATFGSEEQTEKSLSAVTRRNAF
jgi:hypothetical protein